MTTILFFLSLPASKNRCTDILKLAMVFELVERQRSGRLSDADLARFRAAHTGDRRETE